MWIQGLQKLSLLDYPEKMAATIFTASCNFRCPFCHNASLVTRIDDKYRQSTEEVMAFLKKRRNLLEGVCITGGEPLLQEDLIDFIRDVKSLGYAIKLDTNGSDAKQLQYLVEQGLIDYVAMDIKNAPNKYALTIDVEEDFLPEILQSVAYLLSDAVEYEFRTTLVQEFHKREDIAVLGKWLRGAKRYYLQQFTDSGDLINQGCHGYDDYMMNQIWELMKEYIPNVQLRGVE